MARKPTPSQDKPARKRKKMALGKGLEALIPGGAETAGDASGYRMCAVERI